MTDKQTSAPRGVSRRAVAKGVAWATPVVAVAAVAPAASASPLPPLALTGRGCKKPAGSKGSDYYFELKLDQTTTLPSSVAFTFTWSQSGTMSHIGQQPGSFTQNTVNIPAGTDTIVLKFRDTDQAANGTLAITYTIGNQTYTTSVFGDFNANCPTGINKF